MITFDEYKTTRDLTILIEAYDVDPDQFRENILVVVREFGPEGLTEDVLDEIWNPFSKIAQAASGVGAVGAAPFKAAGRGAMRGAGAIGRGAQAAGRGALAGAQELGGRALGAARATGRGAMRGAEAVGGAIKGAAGAVGEKYQQGVQAQQIAQANDRITGLEMSMKDLGIPAPMAIKVSGQIRAYIAKKTGLDPQQFAA